jgi:hypothetical protein
MFDVKIRLFVRFRHLWIVLLETVTLDVKISQPKIYAVGNNWPSSMT